jgi:hypothetical protein
MYLKYVDERGPEEVKETAEYLARKAKNRAEINDTRGSLFFACGAAALALTYWLLVDAERVK